jgi:hypothetical protein
MKGNGSGKGNATLDKQASTLLFPGDLKAEELAPLDFYDFQQPQPAHQNHSFQE